MKVVLLGITLVVAIVLVFGILYAARLFSNTATPITVHAVDDGVMCATMVTSDGAAISCWKIDKK